MKKIILSSYRLKLVGSFSLVTIVALFTFSYWIYTETRDWFSTNIDASLSSTAESLDKYLTNQLDSTWETKLETKIDSLEYARKLVIDSDHALKLFTMIYESINMNPRRYFIQIFDINNELVWKSNNLKEVSLPTFPNEEKIDELKTYVQSIYTYTTIPKYIYRRDIEGVPGDTVYLNIPFQKSEMRLYIAKSKRFTVSVGYSRKSLDAILYKFSLFFYYGMPLIAFLLISLLLFISKLAYQPIEKMGETIDRMDVNTLELDLPYHYGDDEYGRMASSLKFFSEKVKIAFDKSQGFASDASHELKTPLTILRGELELALNNDNSIEDYQAVIASCLDEIMRLNNVVDTLLELSRADRGKVKMNFSTYNINDLLADIVEDIEIIAEEKEIKINYTFEESLAIQIDKPRMHQALLNIIENAVKYTPAGGEVNIVCTSNNNETKISVSDTGIGIPQEQIPLVFERFYRATQPSKSNISGTGLGLSIAKWVVDSHNGRINIESEVGKGTIFTITLPEINNE